MTPENGAEFTEAPSLVTVVVDVDRGEALTRLRIEVDGVEVAAEPISADGRHQLDVEVAEGTHELVGVAEDDCGGDGESEPITIVVTAPETPNEEDPPVEDEEEDVEEEEQDAEEAEKGGCSVGRVPTRSVVGLSAFCLFVLGAWRLRRKEAA